MTIRIKPLDLRTKLRIFLNYTKHFNNIRLVLTHFFLTPFTLTKKCSLLKIEINTSWVNFTYFPKRTYLLALKLIFTNWSWRVQYGSWYIFVVNVFVINIHEILITYIKFKTSEEYLRELDRQTKKPNSLTLFNLVWKYYKRKKNHALHTNYETQS